MLPSGESPSARQQDKQTNTLHIPLNAATVIRGWWVCMTTSISRSHDLCNKVLTYRDLSSGQCQGTHQTNETWHLRPTDLVFPWKPASKQHRTQLGYFSTSITTSAHIIWLVICELDEKLTAAVKNPSVFWCCRLSLMKGSCDKINLGRFSPQKTVTHYKLNAKSGREFSN